MTSKRLAVAMLCCASAMAAAQGHAGMPAAPAASISPDWARVARLKPGTNVIVDTGLYPIGPQAGDRCRIVAVDATTLTCKTGGWHRKRWVFPAAAVGSVYHVRHVLTIGDFFAMTGAALFVGGAIFTSAGPLLIGAVILLYVGTAGMADGAAQAVRAGLAQPRPIPSNERDDLIYLRPFQPAAAPASALTASMP